MPEVNLSQVTRFEIRVSWKILLLESSFYQSLWFCLWLTALDRCALSSCSEEGTRRCVDNGVDYVCECSPGFTGRNCEASEYMSDVPFVDDFAVY